MAMGMDARKAQSKENKVRYTALDAKSGNNAHFATNESCGSIGMNS